MPKGSYGQVNTTAIRDKDLYLNIEGNVTDFPDYRRELLKRLDGANFENEVTSHKYEWSARRKRPMKAKLAQTYASGTTLIVDEPAVFNVDDLIEVKGQQARVLQVTGGVTLKIEPLPGESIPASDVGTFVSIVGGATPHGKDADTGLVTGLDDYYNYVSNFEGVVNVSSTYNASKVRGNKKPSQLIVDEQMYLTQKLQRTILAGKRNKDSINDITYAGGVLNMIELYAPSNVIDFGGASVWQGASADRVIQDKLDSAFALVSEKAFEKPVIWVGPKFMGRFKHIQTDRAYTASESPSAKRGVGVVRKYDTHVFGTVDVVQLMGLDDVLDDKLLIVDESDIGYKALIPWRTYPLSKTGQSYNWQVEGMYTVKVGIPEAHVVLTNLGVK